MSVILQDLWVSIAPPYSVGLISTNPTRVLSLLALVYATDCDLGVFLPLICTFWIENSHRAAHGPLTFPIQRAGDKKFAGPEWENYKQSVIPLLTAICADD